MEIQFITKNNNKSLEASEFLSKYGITVHQNNTPIDELQITDIDKLIHDKALKAYKEVKKPLIVEHTSLFIRHLNNFPGGLTQIFWDRLGADKFCEMFKNTNNKKIYAVTTIGYCDGKMVKIFKGKLHGTIAETPRGSRGFGWDCIFIPDPVPGLIPEGNTRTLAQLPAEKSKISMRTQALKRFVQYINKENKKQPCSQQEEIKPLAETEAFKKLAEAVSKKNVILFVGAGVSRTLGLQTWDELISHMGTELGYDENIFKMLGDSLSLAEYYELEKKKDNSNTGNTNESNIKSLTDWMKENWGREKIDITEHKIHKLIVDLDFPIIYTTNYDKWLEYAYESFAPKDKQPIPIANVNDIVNIRDGVTQIVKLHGDIDDDSSIVLTESSYFERLNFEHPLDIKFRSDILGKSILFIGYSLSDINIRYLLYNLNKLWNSKSAHNMQPKSYIFMHGHNAVQEQVLNSRFITPLVSTKDKHQDAYIELLESLKIEVDRLNS